MASVAAFFDLDRTLLLGASGPVISAGLRRHGIISERFQTGERLAFGLFNVVGETLPSILLTRQGVRAAKGWPVEAVHKVAAEIAPELDELVEPFARETLAEHRAAGRLVVLATTTPYDLVRPFAERLGFDDVLATRYRTMDHPDGDSTLHADPDTGAGDDADTGPDRAQVYAGSIDGEFVWSNGKARSVTRWASANLVDLGESYAYSDSFFDLPMLSKVGNPVAVNPDPRLLAYATLRGWPRVWFNAPPGVPKPLGIEPQNAVARLARLDQFPWVRFEIEGLENLPDEGGAVLASNHRSYLDPLVIGTAAARAGRAVRFLAKKEVTDAPLVGTMTRALGAIRVDRGSGSAQPLLEAARALRAGELVSIFPQGTIPRGEAFFDPDLKGRHGAARLARSTGVAVVPVGIWGSEHAWPRNSRVPYVMNVADPPTVTVRIGEPFHLPAGDLDATAGPELDDATAEIMQRITELLPPEGRERITPTPAQLARTIPAGAADS
jgi:putative phosphoserine phosphatase/1-acylglycerol-3-phosphate O-acyltransferase